MLAGNAGRGAMESMIFLFPENVLMVGTVLVLVLTMGSVLITLVAGRRRIRQLGEKVTDPDAPPAWTRVAVIKSMIPMVLFLYVPCCRIAVLEPGSLPSVRTSAYIVGLAYQSPCL